MQKHGKGGKGSGKGNKGQADAGKGGKARTTTPPATAEVLSAPTSDTSQNGDDQGCGLLWHMAGRADVRNSITNSTLNTPSESLIRAPMSLDGGRGDVEDRPQVRIH